MNRRSFIQKCIAGVALGGASLLVRAGSSAEKTDVSAGELDPEALEKKSLEIFLAGKKTCCEAITMAGCACIGQKSEIIPDICLGLAGGIGMQGSVCGVISGSAMVISLAAARKEPDYKKRRCLF